MKKTFIPLFVGLLCWTGAQAATINHAYDGTKTAAQNGDALKTTISNATSGDEIRVQVGTYQGNFTFKDGVNVSGGWNSAFDVQNGATILDANNSGRPVSSTTELSTLTIWSNLTIQGGNPNDGGGGAHLRANARLDHCLIQNNTTGGTNKAAGGVQLYNGGQLYNSIVRNNTATGDCGGVRLHSYNNSEKPAKLVNCLIYGNTATNTIGGVSLESCYHYVYNNTVVNNSQTSSANAERCGVRLNVGAPLLFANNIVWGNKVGSTVQDVQMQFAEGYSGKGAYFTNNAVVLSETFGTNTILLTESPFVDAAHGDYSLKATSSLIDAGNNAKKEGDIDLVGNDRIVNSTIDIGAYEGRYVRVKSGDNLQYRISCATTLAGNEVRVQAGTFTGNFTMREGVNVSGGWNSTFDAQNGTTTLDANHSGRVVNQTSAFENLTVWSNLTIKNGSNAGAAGAYVATNGQLDRCIIEDNATTNTKACGGVQIHNGGIVTNSIIRNNTSSEHTGGARVTCATSGSIHPSTLANCLIYGNSAAQTIGGVSLENGVHYVYNNTVVNNSQTSSENAERCGVRLNVGAALLFANNIVWGNKVGSAVQDVQMQFAGGYSDKGAYFTNNAVVLSSDFGTNTILLTESPFADADYHLNPFSELINSGNNDKYSGTTDLDGNPRKQGTIDRGCYEQTMYSRTVTEGNYGTICLPFAVEEGSFNGAKIYKVVSFADELQRGIVLEEVDAMEAGKPYFFLGEASTVKFRYVRAGDEAAAGNENGLYGTISGTTVSGQGKYVLQNNELRQTYNEATSSDIEINLDKNRAYLVFSEIPDAPAVAPVLSPRRRVIGVHQTPTGMETITNDQYTNKVIKDGRLIIIRDGKMYNALGQQL